MNNEKIIRTARFDQRVCTYWILSGATTLLTTIVGIPLLLVWFPLGLVFTKRYLQRIECVLTEKTLVVKKGILVRTEKSIPIDNITDLGMVQGPLMRHYGLHKLTVETAGQTSAGALVSLTGIVDTEGFREAVLARRDKLADQTDQSGSQPQQNHDGDVASLLTEIRDTLRRIESSVASQSTERPPPRATP